jgi:flagellar M-ring protein FliF
LNQIRELFQRLTNRQKISLALAVFAIVGGIYWWIGREKDKDFKPLFRGLAAEDAGHLTARLKEKNVEFRVDEDGTTILVRSARLSELRLELAAQGLPRTGRIGFEIFDKTNFALTEFAEQVNYQRALEGELERTVSSLREVDHARVHITFAKQSIFQDNRAPAKASIVLKLKSGAKLNPASVQSIVFLMSSAVEGLAPEHVSIIDHNGSLLNRPRRSLTADDEVPELLLEYRQKVERDLLLKVNSTLTPLLGEEKYRAGITVDCDMTSGESSEEIFDPEKAVVTSEQKTEDMSGIPLASGVPGTPSSLPRPTSRPASESRGTQRKTESTNYQASRTVRRTKIPQGAIRRISLSVLLDQEMRWEGVGPKAKRVFDPPSAEKIKAIKDVLTGTVGLVAERGDLVIVESLPFDATLRVPAPAAPVPPAQPKPLFEIPAFLLNILPPPLKDPAMLLAVVIAAGVLVLVLGLGVFFFLRNRKKKKISATEGAKALSGSSAGDAAALEGGAEDGRTFEERLAEQQDLQKRLEQKELEKLKMPHVTTQKGKILAQHITDEAKKDPVMIAHILRSWLHEDTR